MTRLSALEWGVKHLISNDLIDSEPQQLITMAEADGYFLWVTEFIGTTADYLRLEVWYKLLDHMFEAGNYMVETKLEYCCILFESASDAIQFRFALTEQTA
jgi:hypothetical protein